jgi:hypothetical protein
VKFSALFSSLFVYLVWAHSTARNAVVKERLFAVVDCINIFEQRCSENPKPYCHHGKYITFQTCKFKTLV